MKKERTFTPGELVRCNKPEANNISHVWEIKELKNLIICHDSAIAVVVAVDNLDEDSVNIYCDEVIMILTSGGRIGWRLSSHFKSET